jgi:hypothetical protein
VQVRRDDGVASHIGPEPCVVARKGDGEASVGEHKGQPLSSAKIHIPGADVVREMRSRSASHGQSAQRVIVIDELADAFSILTLRASRFRQMIVTTHFLVDDEMSKSDDRAELWTASHDVDFKMAKISKNYGLAERTHNCCV